MAGFFNLTKEKLINKVVEIAINEILPNPYQPRTDFNEDISALADEIEDRINSNVMRRRAAFT